MINQDDHFDCLVVRIVCHRSAVMEEVQRRVEKKYVVRTISDSKDQSQDDLVVIKLYEMNLFQLIRWFEEYHSSTTLEEITRITPLTP